MSIQKSAKPMKVKVRRAEKHGKDNFTMQVPVINVDVIPDEYEPWGMIVKGKKYGSIDIEFGGETDNSIGYQAATLRFRLQDEYEWFCDGLEIVAIEEKTGKGDSKVPFKTFLDKRYNNHLDMTIQVTEQRAFSSAIKFRFIVCEKHQYVNEHNPLKVLVSEDPIVTPNKPVGE